VCPYHVSRSYGGTDQILNELITCEQREIREPTFDGQTHIFECAEFY